MFFGSKVNYLSKNKRALSKYSVGSQEPGLAFDFIDNVYQKDQNQTVNFDGAITHARSGNATMTDGYGPELVTNGGFDSDLSGWTVSAGEWEWQEGRAHLNTTTYSILSQNVSSEKAVEISFTVADYNGSGGFLIMAREYDGTYRELTRTNSNSTGSIRVQNLSFYVADVSTIEIWRQNPSTAANGYIDSVLVREMPVIKWAPHNLLTYSEEFDNAAWSKTSTIITANSATAPDGTTTADTLSHTADGAIFSQAFTASIVKHTVGIFVKQVDHRWFRIFADVGSVWFDLDSGTVGTVNSGLSDASITDVGNGWYRCEVSVVTPTASFSVSPLLATANASFAESVGTSVYIWGAHIFRSDLGGMVDNPDRGDSYVPTTSSAVYLPRIGHHVYNGSAWVNEGLLAESESRVNLTPYSDFASDILVNNLTVSTNQAVSPDGAESATELTETGANNYHRVYQNTNITGTANSDHTFSAYVKRGSGTRDIQLRAFYLGTGAPYVNFDLGDGTVGASSGASGTSASSHTWTLANTNIQEVGNGWYRISATIDASSDFTVGFVLVDDAATAVEQQTYQGNGTSSVLIYGAQFEEGFTPSSLIPNYGTASGVTRAAETFTIPSANLPWPEPVYIGSELITNGDFELGDNGDWTKSDFTISGGQASTSSGISGYVDQSISFVSGKVYELSVDVVSISGGSASIQARGVSTIASTIGAGDSGTTHKFIYADTVNNTTLRVFAGSNTNLTIDNVSVRELAHPLAVSIAMDGRVTYADEDSTSQGIFWQWRNDVNNRLLQVLRTNLGTGELQTNSIESGTADEVRSGSSQYSPDIFVPFDIASRHGSTFVNAAVEGVALTANTTPTALPDLSAIDLDLADDYMGTIGTFRVWDRDLGDDGIVEATNPSLEPSLSLEFSGLGTNSFVIADWSE